MLARWVVGTWEPSWQGHLVTVRSVHPPAIGTSAFAGQEHAGTISVEINYLQSYFSAVVASPLCLAPYLGNPQALQHSCTSAPHVWCSERACGLGAARCGGLGHLKLDQGAEQPPWKPWLLQARCLSHASQPIRHPHSRADIGRRYWPQTHAPAPINGI